MAIFMRLSSESHTIGSGMPGRLGTRLRAGDDPPDQIDVV
jgi:hypothetical protein